MRACYAMTIAALAASTSIPAPPAQANEVEAFYKGKSVDLIIASEVGGGYDLYARLIGPFLEKHLPGNPRLCRSK